MDIDSPPADTPACPTSRSERHSPLTTYPPMPGSLPMAQTTITDTKNEASESTKSAQLSVLNSYDLLTLILSTFEGEKDKNSQLSTIAKVSKGFKGPALDVLWKSLDTFMPLLMALPHLEKNESSWYFHGNIQISTFPEYALRVRSITLPVVPAAATFSGQVFVRLAKQLAGLPLLPGLRDLRILDVGPMTSSLLPLLLSPSLQSIEFGQKALSQTHLHQSFFPSLPTDLPSLRRLVMNHDDISFRLESTIFDAILGSIGLQALEITLPGTPFAPPLLISIGKVLPQLLDLTLDIQFTHERTQTVVNRQSVAIHTCPPTPLGVSSLFQSLRTLHLIIRDGNTCHFNSGITFCTAFPPSFLERLTSLTVFISTAVLSLADLIQCLCRAPGFRRIKFTQRADQVGTVPLHVVVPLFDIPTIEEVIVDISTLNLDQTALQTLIDAAYKPQKSTTLRTLVLPAKSSLRLSLGALEYVAQHANGLQRLSLTIDSAFYSFKEGFKVESVSPNSTLRHLEISDARAQANFSLMEHSNIANFLDTIFPNLESMKPYRDSRGVGAQHEENWNFIEHLRKQAKLLRVVLKP